MKSLNFDRFCWLALLLSTCGCVESDQPLSEPRQASFDAQLLGAWKPASKKGGLHLHFLPVSEEADKKPPKWTKMVIVDHAKSHGGVSAAFCFPTTLDNVQYLNMLLIEPQKDEDRLAHFAALFDDEFDGEKLLSLVKGYWIVKYEVEGEALSLFAADSRIVKRAIREGKLKGKDGKVSDTTAALVDFLTKQGEQTFPAKNATRYVRVK